MKNEIINKYLNEEDYDDFSVDPIVSMVWKRTLKKYKLKTLSGLKGNKASEVLDYMELQYKKEIKKKK